MKHKQIRKLIREMFMQVYEKLSEECQMVESTIPDTTENRRVIVTSKPFTDNEPNSIVSNSKIPRKQAG